MNLTYWGTAQAKPWTRVSRGSGNGATLFANSTLALNADTGKLAWYYDHAPGETLDLDEVFERVLVDDQGQSYVFSAGKTGILWKLDRKTGKYLGHKEMVFQNVYDSFDPATGRAALPQRYRGAAASANGSPGVRPPKAARTGPPCPTINPATA